MTTIDRLGLFGIRSYGTEEEIVIKFFKPLTIILGRNGSGKSTVIEAVKMATTGDLPPNIDRGTAFIHDPRIDNETETKAKIRLMFTNICGDEFVVSRHFQLTIRPGPHGVGYKPEFKTLDQTLKHLRSGGSGSATSYRGADMNALLPEVMRVTKPVLNNVIFVHQEESLWPLGDSRKVKEKFDEIFAATRYTKALETIRKYRRDQTNELKTVNVELRHYEDKVRILEKIRSEVDRVRTLHDGLRKGQEELTELIAQKEAELSGAQQLTDTFEEKRSELKKLQIEASLLEKDKAEKYSAMQVHVRDMSDDDIHVQMEEYKRSLGRADEERKKRAKLIDELTADIEMKREEFNARQARRGMLEQQSKLQDDRLERLESMKAEYANSDLFTKAFTEKGKSVVIPNTSSSLDTWTTALEDMQKDAELNVQQITDDCNASLDNANEQVSTIKLKVEAAKADEKRKTGELAQKRTEIANIRSELRSLEGSQSSTVDAENKSRVADKTFNDKKASNAINDLENGIKKHRKQLSLLRDDLSSSRRVREQLLQDQNEQARLQLSRETSLNKKKQVDFLMEEFSDLLLSNIDLLIAKGCASSDFAQLKQDLRRGGEDLHSNVDERRRELMDASSRILAKRDALIQMAEENLNEAKANLSSIVVQKAELKRETDIAKRQLSKIDGDLTRLKLKLDQTGTELSEAAESSNADNATTDLKVDTLINTFANVKISSEDTRNLLRSEHVQAAGHTSKAVDLEIVKVNQKISQLETGVFIAEGDLQSFESDSKHRCPACGMSSSKRVTDMRNNLKERVDFFKNPANLRAAEKSRKAVEAAALVVRDLYSHCSSALSAVEMFNKSSERLRNAEREDVKLRTLCGEANGAWNSLVRSIGPESSLEHILSRRLELKQGLVDFEKAEKEASQLQASASAGSGETMSLAEVEKKVRNIEEKMEELQDKVDRDGRTLDREREDLRRTENRAHLARQQCLELKANSEKHKRLKAQKEELMRGISDAENEIEMLRNNRQNLDADMEYAETEFHATRADNVLKTRDANALVSNRKMAMQSWKECIREVDVYSRSGKRRDLQKIVESLEAIESDVKSKGMDLKGHERDQQTASDSQKDMEARIRNLRDNQLYRLQEQAASVNARSMRHVQDEIDELIRQAGQDPIMRVKRMNEELHKKRSDLHATKAKRHLYVEQYDEKRKELKEAESEGSRRKFDQFRIRKQTMQLASNDLERYHRALDQALMAFHTLKMSSINRTIKELWQQTYRGTDIDEIEVTSDHGDGRPDGTGLTRRNFNYRVLMRRGQASLDMRGRCSSGQKVLACLVIRLALAESFCTDCGILALDEPTTNLDRTNITSLALALRAIIETRRYQNNFQLILITHDEEFIEMIGARDFCSEYFKIYKNEHHKSCAKIESLLEVGA